MGFLDDAKKKLTDAVDRHGDKINDGLDKAAAAADKRTGGKHSDKIREGVAKAKQGLDNLDGRDDDLPGTGGRAGTTATSGQGTQHPAGRPDPAAPTAAKDPKAPTGPMGDGTPGGTPGVDR